MVKVKNKARSSAPLKTNYLGAKGHMGGVLAYSRMLIAKEGAS